MASSDIETLPQSSEGADIERAEGMKNQTSEREPTALSQDTAFSPIANGQSQDIGAAEQNEKSVAKESQQLAWDGPNDPNNPHNWPQWKKWLVTIIVSLGGMVTMMSSTVMAPALPTIARALHTNESTTNMTLSIFVLSFGLGSMVLAPMTEVFGRKPVWILSGCFYVLWNTVCGFSHTNGLLIAGRLFAGLGSSAQYAVENPVLADVWRPEQRGLSFAVATLLPFLGPAIGPIIGGAVTDSALGWRWLFWILSIFDAVLIASALFLFPETYARTILRRNSKSKDWDGESLGHVLVVSCIRPCRLLLTRPHIQLMAFYLAYNYGILYIVLTTFATLWIETYGQSETIAGLHYIAITLGSMIAAQGGAPVMDRVWRYLKARAKGETQPEYRVPLMVPGAILIPVGLFWYGWSAQARAVWIVPDIGIAVFSCGIIVSTQTMQAYVIDSYPEYVASASAASQLPRNIAAFGFPLFASQMYQALGYGWGNSLLAFIFLAIGLPAPAILWKFGAGLRAKTYQH